MGKNVLKHPRILQARDKALQTAARLADNHVRLAVTGLSGSGKTTFITSLINQLMEAKEGASLPFLSVLQQQRLIGVSRDSQPDLELSRFDYEGSMAKLGEDTPQWPTPTRGISQVRLKLRYRPQSSLKRLVSDDAVLLLDIVDYPGEWLLDLPLLEMGFKQWCQLCQQGMDDPKRQELAQDFTVKLKELDLLAEADENLLQKLSLVFTRYLHQCKDAGFQLIQPGRFVLPGEMAGAPLLQFFPLMTKVHGDIDWQNIPANSNLAMLQQRFESYKRQVVKPFYQRYFRYFDRQVVLVDCLGALNHGAHSMQDLQQAMEWLMKSFDYGKSGILRRIFSPRIDKLLFAASQADQVTAEQQQNLSQLLSSMVREARKAIQYQGIDIETTAIAAIKASVQKQAEHQGKTISILQGVSSDGQGVSLYPGDVPRCCPPANFWQQHKFAYPEFRPPKLPDTHILPHIRMDHLLEYLLGDKLQ